MDYFNLKGDLLILKLILKEIKFQLKSIALILCIIVMILILKNEIDIEAYNLPLEPLDEMHYMYYKLNSDYMDGIIDLHEVGRIEKINLNIDQKKKIANIIQRINTNWNRKFEDISRVDAIINYKEYDRLLSQLDKELGGNTYYGLYRDALFSTYRYKYYGFIKEKKPEKAITIMCGYLNSLVQRGKLNQYSSIGIGKERRLSGKEKVKIIKISNEIKNEDNDTFTSTKRMNIAKNKIYRLDKYLGGNTEFGDNIYNHNVYLSRVKTFKEAKESFYMMQKSNDKITNAYARVYMDYEGIIAGIIPAFIASFVLIRDKKYHMQELIYYRSFSSIKYVITKFIAVSFIFMIFFMGTATVYTIVFHHFSILYHYSIDLLAFYKYTIAWIMPTIFITVSICFFVSILFDSGLVAIVVQMVLYVLSIISIEGDYRWFKIIIRMNNIKTFNEYELYGNQIITNRIIMCMISGLFIFLSYRILDQRRTLSNEKKILHMGYRNIQLKN